ncbi:STAS domain-containing protein [Panacagrimonas sp.]|uniref:STAS domain-containing protein n=1 Tax=Panacagrimonas sp. TaxID=2480088 RepID=UPI003B51CD9B
MAHDLTFAHMRQWLPQADALAQRETFDLADIDRLDSAGAAFLLELTRRASRHGRTLRLINAPPQVRGLLESLQLDGVLKLEA